ncbi:MAG: AAA family ATPase [Alphaproteobacteria bacterium]|nr:AAA family ATPase [Alphaproteobacteria bacterium]
MQFNKLRLQGFKSFVDGTELEIAQGLTGVVGPNGCGKSNLVEGLRWVMGETSAKQMRGAGMDDIIFGGTTDRPARNVAEVVLSLDNGDRSAPSQFNGSEEVEVSRRIEREKGSTYRVNGQEVRARDVQILFADQATGPRSTALVSQGRVGAVINAKPTDRRLLLEEAAGITGLHSRRHEAELRLRAAETNLERLEDVLITLDTQLTALKKQARQAKRYRNISHDIRKTESVVLHHRWTEASEQVATAKAALGVAETAVAEETSVVGQATVKREGLAEAVAPLRDAEVRAAAELQRLTMARNELDAEEKRVLAAIEQWTTRRNQIAADLAREQGLTAEAEAALARLTGERSEIERARAGEGDLIEAANKALDQARNHATEVETELAGLAEQVAGGDAQLAAIDRELSDLAARANRRRQQHATASEERDTLTAQGIDPALLSQAEDAVAAIEAQLAKARSELDTAEQARAEADSQREAARELRAAKEEIRARLRAEAAALQDLLASDSDDGETWTPVLNDIDVTPGYEAALGAALGDDLEASADEAAPRHWRRLPILSDEPKLPAGARPLVGLVGNAAPLARSLSQVGVVDDAATGARLSSELKTGQRLVDRDGNLWRWDGFVASAETRSTASARLKQRNRLADLESRIPDADSVFAQADSANERIVAAATAAADSERSARDKVRHLDGEVAAARSRHSELAQEINSKKSRLESLQGTVAHLETEMAEIAQAIEAAQARRNAIGDLDTLRDDVAVTRVRLSEARVALQAAQIDQNRLVREAEERQRRITAIVADEGSWDARRNGAAERVGELKARDAGAVAELETLAARPLEIESQRNSLMDTLNDADAARRAAADKVAIAEGELSEAEKALRAAEARLTETREDKVRAEAAVAQAGQTLEVVCDRIAERLECAPEKVLALAEIPEGRDIPDLESAEKRFERLIRERDNMGPVNLRAEQEADELAEKIATVEAERDDLVTAIARLRQGISNLNREARQRLVKSFEEVNKHFQELFVRIFGGGGAHLALTEADDPLQAGLDIFASPPGKKLQNLTLLSGGEQTMTAIALLFAVFLTNPAPICVLDEVDAALDDANVDRFCTLLSEIAATGDTRFLVVTHHRMTMSRMDRLYGVTMPEQGVSQLVSVDLRQAEEIRATA